MSETGQNFFLQLWLGEGSENRVAVALLALQLLDLMTKGLLGLADRSLIDTLGVFLPSFASSTGHLTVTLR
jgi:hypothetical protein